MEFAQRRLFLRYCCIFGVDASALDLFPNSTTTESFVVEAVLESSRIPVYAAVLCAASPKNLLVVASLERGL